MTAEECREIARKFFAAAVTSDCPAAREDAIIQGEEWMGHWRYWTDAKASLTAPGFEPAAPGHVIPYRF